MTLRLAAACVTAALLWLVTSHLGHVAGLQCYTCDGWDNKSKCSDPAEDSRSHVRGETCKEPPPGKAVYCITIHRDVCQAAVFKSSKDLVGNGGGRYKRHWNGACVYVDTSDERFTKYSKCYWERIRGGRDVLHKISGFQVVGRSVIKRTCHCNTDLCNSVASKVCRNIFELRFSENCGPNCLQVSRDQLETPGVKEEEFRDQCPHRSDGENKRLYEDCGIDKNRFEPDKLLGFTYRHTSYLGIKDGYRKSSSSSLADSAYLYLAVWVTLHLH